MRGSVTLGGVYRGLLHVRLDSFDQIDLRRSFGILAVQDLAMDDT